MLTDNRQVTNSWPTVNRLSTNCPPTLFSLNWENCQLTVGRLSADRFFWELFFNFSPLIAIAWSNVIPYYLQSQLPWVITQVQDDKICWSLLCKRWLFIKERLQLQLFDWEKCFDNIQRGRCFWEMVTVQRCIHQSLIWLFWNSFSGFHF